MNYWQDRAQRTQARLTNKNIEETEKQLEKYYAATMKRMRGGFLSTYNKVLNTIEKGKEATPADLYKLDAYWKLMGEAQRELTLLGNKQASTYRRKFVEQYMDVYNAFAVKDDTNFNAMDKETALQMIQQIWCADGKTWSDRIWTNVAALQQALNDELVHCVITGADTNTLRQLLMEEFQVSFHKAETLIRTEMAHIQTQAATQRYKDAGVKYVQVWADEDERRCDICGKLHTEVIRLGVDTIPIPAHPNCRCCLLPVIDKQAGQFEGLLELNK